MEERDLIALWEEEFENWWPRLACILPPIPSDHEKVKAGAWQGYLQACKVRQEMEKDLKELREIIAPRLDYDCKCHWCEDIRRGLRIIDGKEKK